MIEEPGGERSETDDFEGFVRRAYPGLVRLGFLLMGDPGRGEDLVQSALSALYLRWGSLRTVDAAGAYTRTVMVREASRWRRRRWTGETPAIVADGARTSPDGFDDRATAQIVRDALQALPIAQRAVLVLRYYEQRSEAEIGEILGISPGTVKSRTSRALTSLRAAGLLDQVLEG